MTSSNDLEPPSGGRDVRRPAGAADAGLPDDDSLRALHELASELGVLTRYVDGLGRTMEVPVETLLTVCSALGPTLDSVGAASTALEEVRARSSEDDLPPVMVAWDGKLRASDREKLRRRLGTDPVEAALELEDGTTLPAHRLDEGGSDLPSGYHRLRLQGHGSDATCTVISAPGRAWRHPDRGPSWGLSAHLAAVRSRRSRSVGDLADLETLTRWMADRGGGVMAVLPLLPTYNRPPTEPSPYAPVSRLFWSELILDLGDAHRPTPSPSRIDVQRADAEVRAALASDPDPASSMVDEPLRRYARFRGAQARLGRDWRSWPAEARDGAIGDDQVDPAEERFHRVAQVAARSQLQGLRDRLAADGVHIGLDLAVGVHPDGFDTWSRRELFVSGMSVGAPPDRAFPSGQDWGFPPVDPRASRAEGHGYAAAAVGHHARVAGFLRIDHVMSLTRLFWIPGGGGVRDGTYVRYPVEELLAVHVLESHHHRCTLVGENLGVVPPEVDEALERHAIHGMSLVQFEAEADEPEPPDADEVAMVGNHDTATFAGWLEGRDIDERVRHGLLDPEDAEEEHEARQATVRRLMDTVCGGRVEAEELLGAVMEWLGSSPSPMVLPWVEDLWLEPEPVNVPGTRSSQRPNWQRPWRRLLDDVVDDPEITALLDRLNEARAETAEATDAGEADADAGTDPGAG